MARKTDQKFIIAPSELLPFKTAITGQDARHITKVLRLGKDQTLRVTDGRGNDYTAVILSTSTSAVEVEIIQKNFCKTESPLTVTLCCGMLKDKKMDFIIKHATTLGINQWIPFFCERSIPLPGKKRLAGRHQRWETISKESLKQCRRSRLVDISMPVSFSEALQKAKDHDLNIAFWEKAGMPLKNLPPSNPVTSVMILIGPEGGFSEKEIRTARDHGFLSCSLGPRILRAETAAISSCTLIQHLLGDI